MSAHTSSTMDRWNGKVAIVTGASDGIGASIAEKLVKAGLKVVGFARRPELIEENAKALSSHPGKLYAFKVDVTVEAEIIAGFQWTTKTVGPVHILINNAGISLSTGLSDGDTGMWKKVLDTNVLGLAIATREAYKIMVANKIDGHIVHINSIVGHKVVFLPGVGMYGASKFAVSNFHECLRKELIMKGSKIKLSSVSPGVVKNNFFINYGEVGAQLKSGPALLVDDVADSVIFVLSTPPHVQIHELIMQAVGENF